MKANILRMGLVLCFIVSFSSCKLEVDAGEIGKNNPNLLNLADGSNLDPKTNKDNQLDNQDGSKKKKPSKKVTEVLNFNQQHTYLIDVSELITDQEEHVQYDNFKDPKKIGDLFREIMSKSISHENSKKLDPVVEKLIKISKYYAKNQADLIYFLNSFVESLNRESVSKRKFDEDYYYPYEYLQYGIKSDFENITMLSTILYNICYRPKIAIIDLDVQKSRIGIELFQKDYDYDQIFQNDQPRMDNFEKLVMRAPRCSVDISDLIKKPEEVKLVTGEDKMLNVAISFSKDSNFLQLTIQPTETEALSEYYKNSILLIDSVDLKFVVKAIEDRSPPIPPIGQKARFSLTTHGN